MVLSFSDVVKSLGGNKRKKRRTREELEIAEERKETKVKTSREKKSGYQTSKVRIKNQKRLSLEI